MRGVRGLMKIDQVHCRNDVSDQRDLSDLGLATHRRGHGDSAGLQRELGLPGVLQPGCQEPATHGNVPPALTAEAANGLRDRKSTRLNSSHSQISYAVFC